MIEYRKSSKSLRNAPSEDGNYTSSGVSVKSPRGESDVDAMDKKTKYFYFRMILGMYPRNETYYLHSIRSSYTSAFFYLPLINHAHLFMNIGPIFFILQHIPGSIRRMLQAMGRNASPGNEHRLSMAQSFLDPFAGAINFILYVALDPTLRGEWIEYLTRKMNGLMRKSENTLTDEIDYSNERGMEKDRKDVYNGRQSELPMNPLQHKRDEAEIRDEET